MIITNRIFDFAINVDENTIASIVCENPKALYEMMDDLIGMFNFHESSWIISENDGERIDVNKLELILNPFYIEINSKKLLGKVYKEIEDCITGYFLEEMSNINNIFVGIMDSVSKKLSYDIDFNFECNSKDILKIYNVKLHSESCSLLEKLSVYIKLISTALNAKCLFMMDIKRYLSEEEILTLYKEARYWKVHLVLIESKFERKLENEKTIIIDKDRCIIRL